MDPFLGKCVNNSLYSNLFLNVRKDYDLDDFSNISSFDNFTDIDLNWHPDQLEEIYKTLRDSQTTINIILTVFLALIFVIGLSGNTTVLAVFTRSKRKQTANIFIMVLAVSDLLICAIVLPGVLLKEWFVPFRWDILCKGWEWLRCATIPLSSLILVLVAVDRYVLICLVGKVKPISIKQTKWTLLAITLTSICLGIPPMLRVGVYQQGSAPNTRVYLGLCMGNGIVMDHDRVERYWQAMAAEFFLVLVTVVILYSLVFRTVYKQSNKWPGGPQMVKTQIGPQGVKTKSGPQIVKTQGIKDEDKNTQLFQMLVTSSSSSPKERNSSGSQLPFDKIVPSKGSQTLNSENSLIVDNDVHRYAMNNCGIKVTSRIKVTDGCNVLKSSTDQCLPETSWQLSQCFHTVEDEYLKTTSASNTISHAKILNLDSIQCQDNLEHKKLQIYKIISPELAQISRATVYNDTTVSLSQILKRGQHYDSSDSRFQVCPTDNEHLTSTTLGETASPDVKLSSLSVTQLPHKYPQNFVASPSHFKLFSQNKIHPTHEGKSINVTLAQSQEKYQRNHHETNRTLPTQTKSPDKRGVFLTQHRRYWMAQVKTAKVLVLVTIVYILSFAPVLLMTLDAVPSHPIPFYCYFIHSAANPLIYSFINQSFCRQMGQLFRCKQ